MNPVVTAAKITPSNWVGFVLGLGAIWAIVTGGFAAFRRGYRKLSPEVSDSLPEQDPDHAEEWQLLCEQAGRIVNEILAQLPAEMAPEARLVPCLFKPRADHEFAGYRTLGHYVNFIPGRISDHKGPILLYLKSIQESCIEKGEDFEEQVKRTYLHELGHHFGWDEIDLAQHGLPSGRPPGR